MGELIRWLIEAPARLIGEIIAMLWPLLAVGVGIGIGWLAFNLLVARARRRPAQIAAVLVGIYACLVFWDAMKWTSLALLEQHRGEQDY